MFVVIQSINDQLTARMESSEDITPDVIDYIECTSRQEAYEVCSLWDTYRYMNKVVPLKDALSQVRETNYPEHNEIEAQYNRYVSHQNSRFGNDVDPEYTPGNYPQWLLDHPGSNRS